MNRKKTINQRTKINDLLEGVRVISFDVGFTLIYPDPPVGEVYVSIASRFGYNFNIKEVDFRFMETWEKATALNRQKRDDNPLADEEQSYLWWKEIFKRSIGDSLAPGDLDGIFKVVYEEFARGKYWQLYPEVHHTLTTLRSKGFRLVVLSNWDFRLKQTLKELNMDHFFEKIYISTRIGFAKPDPGAFRHIINDLKIPGHSILHIGDSPEEDISGAQQANVRALYINRRGSNRPGTDQIPTISSLGELLGFSPGPALNLNK